MRRPLARIAMLCVIGFSPVMPGPFAAAESPSTSQDSFSGKPVPRYESLRFEAVHGRQGPSLDHKILWRYERRDLPVMVVRETQGWRRIRDHDGDEVWVQARMLSEKRTAMVIANIDLYRAPSPQAKPIARLKSGLITELKVCDEGWCEISVDRESGWIPRTTLWGAPSLP